MKRLIFVGLLFMIGCSHEPSAEDKMLYNLQRVKIGQQYPDTGLISSWVVESNERFTKYTFYYGDNPAQPYIHAYVTTDKNNKIIAIWTNQ